MVDLVGRSLFSTAPAAAPAAAPSGGTAAVVIPDVRYRKVLAAISKIYKENLELRQAFADVAWERISDQLVSPHWLSNPDRMQEQLLSAPWLSDPAATQEYRTNLAELTSQLADWMEGIVVKHSKLKRPNKWNLVSFEEFILQCLNAVKLILTHEVKIKRYYVVKARKGESSVPLELYIKLPEASSGQQYYVWALERRELASKLTALLVQGCHPKTQLNVKVLFVSTYPDTPPTKSDGPIWDAWNQSRWTEHKVGPNLNAQQVAEEIKKQYRMRFPKDKIVDMQESFFRCPEEKCGKPMIWTIHRWVDSGQVLSAIYRLEELPPSYHKDPIFVSSQFWTRQQVHAPVANDVPLEDGTPICLLLRSIGFGKEMIRTQVTEAEEKEAASVFFEPRIYSQVKKFKAGATEAVKNTPETLKLTYQEKKDAKTVDQSTLTLSVAHFVTLLLLGLSYDLDVPIASTPAETKETKLMAQTRKEKPKAPAKKNRKSKRARALGTMDKTKRRARAPKRAKEREDDSEATSTENDDAESVSKESEGDDAAAAVAAPEKRETSEQMFAAFRSATYNLPLPNLQCVFGLKSVRLILLMALGTRRHELLQFMLGINYHRAADASMQHFPTCPSCYKPAYKIFAVWTTDFLVSREFGSLCDTIFKWLHHVYAESISTNSLTRAHKLKDLFIKSFSIFDFICSFPNRQLPDYALSCHREIFPHHLITTPTLSTSNTSSSNTATVTATVAATTAPTASSPDSKTQDSKKKKQKRQLDAAASGRPPKRNCQGDTTDRSNGNDGKDANDNNDNNDDHDDNKDNDNPIPHGVHGPQIVHIHPATSSASSSSSSSSLSLSTLAGGLTNNPTCVPVMPLAAAPPPKFSPLPISFSHLSSPSAPPCDKSAATATFDRLRELEEKLEASEASNKEVADRNRQLEYDLERSNSEASKIVDRLRELEDKLQASEVSKNQLDDANRHLQADLERSNSEARKVVDRLCALEEKLQASEVSKKQIDDANRQLQDELERSSAKSLSDKLEEQKMQVRLKELEKWGSKVQTMTGWMDIILEYWSRLPAFFDKGHPEAVQRQAETTAMVAEMEIRLKKVRTNMLTSFPALPPPR